MSFKIIKIAEVWRDDHLLGCIYDYDTVFEAKQDSYDVDESKWILNNRTIDKNDNHNNKNNN